MISREIISQWFDDLKVSYSEKTNAESEWQIIVNYAGMQLSIRKPNELNFLVISRAINVSDEHNKLLENFSSKEHQSFVNQLERDILYCNVQFQLTTNKENNILSSVVFGGQFYGDENSRDSFFNKLNEIHRATLLFISAFKFLEEKNK